ncbi:MAG: hypothetical protein ACYCT7_06735 [bacterium]
MNNETINVNLQSQKDLFLIEESSIELEIYSVEKGLDQIVNEMTYLKNNNQELFKKYYDNVREISAKASMLAQRVRLLNEYLKMEEI